MADHDNRDKVIVLALLKDFKQNYLQPSYNPTVVIEGLLNIIVPRMNYDIDGNGNISTAPESDFLGDILSELLKHNSFFSELYQKYLSSDYGLNIDLSSTETEKLQIVAHYLTIPYVRKWIWLNGPNYRNGLSSDLTNYIHEPMTFLLDRLKKLIDAHLNATDRLSDFEICNNTNLVVNVMDIVKQQIYIFDHLSLIQDQTLLSLHRYDVHNIFLRFFSNTQYDDDNDNQRLYSACRCLSLFLLDDDFSICFIRADGLKYLLKVPKKKITAKFMAKSFALLSNNYKAFMYICNNQDDLISELITYVIWLLNNNYRCLALVFFKSAFTKRIIVSKFDEISGLKYFVDNIRVILNDLTIDDSIFVQSQVLQNIYDYVRTLECYAKSYLRYIEMEYGNYEMDAILHCYIDNHDDDKIATRIENVQNLGISNIFSRSEVENSHKYYCDFMKLLCDIVNYLIDYSTCFTTVKINLSIDSISLYESNLNQNSQFAPCIIDTCLNILSIFSIDLTTVSIVSSCENFISRFQIFKNYINILKVIGNCLWTAIYISRANNNVDDIANISKSKEIYDKILTIIQNKGGIKSFLNWTCMFKPIVCWRTIFRILVALFINENMKQMTIEFGVMLFTSEYWDVINLPHDKQTLFSKYALKFIESILIYKYLYNKPAVEYDKLQTNITLRLLKRPYDHTSVFYNDFVFRKYKKICYLVSDEGQYSACSYIPYESKLIVSSTNGNISVIDIKTGDNKSIFSRSHCTGEIRINGKCNFLITNPINVVKEYAEIYSLDCTYSMNKIQLENRNYLEFDNNYDRIIGTKGKNAAIYDLATTIALSHFVPSKPNLYLKNKATFGHHSQLILNDGTLWDVRSNKEIYRFDKINNNYCNGIFNHNGLEVIFNQCIWDLRNYRLVKIVPQLLRKSAIISTPIIYAYSPINVKNSNYFEVVNNRNYRPITTFTYDSTKQIESIAINSYNTEIAVIENTTENNFINMRIVTESVIQLYNIGMVNITE